MKFPTWLKRKKLPVNPQRLFAFAAAHKVASAVVIILVLVVAAGLPIINVPAVQRSLGVTDPKPNAAEQTKPAVTVGPKLDIPQAAIDNTKPVATRDGACAYQYSDGNGNYYVPIRLSDGSYKCLTYDLNDLKDYTPHTVEDAADMALGHTPVKKQTVTDSGTGVSTTYTEYSDGTSKVTTEGEYYKLYLDRASTMYIMVNSTEMGQRFLYCMTNGYTNADGQPDVRLLTPDEQAQRAALAYPYAGPDCTAGNLPVVHYQ